MAEPFRQCREVWLVTYLGADLTPAIAATSELEFITAVANIYGTVLRTDFPTRSQVIADEIKASGADIIGLQEVSDWTVLGGGGTFPNLNFLDILMSDLGPGYSVKAVSENALLGPFPLAIPNTPCAPTPAGFSCFVEFEDRDVIIVKDNPALKVTESDSGNYDYDEQVVLSILGQPLSFNRGWALIDGTFEGEEFRFVNTHLETEGWPIEQVAQAAAFLAGPANSERATIAVGDFNSAADGSTTASYGLLTDQFADAWGATRQAPGYTCCQAGDLANKKTELDSRIDLVLTRDVAQVLPAHVAGNKRFQKKFAPFWPSDHAGVVARIRLY